MAEAYEVVCVATVHPHRHIKSVGIGGTAKAPEVTMTVDAVREALDNGDTFYTVGPTSKEKADVRKARCNQDGCRVKTLKSSADAVTDNNLDFMTPCG